jgi:hypothetical protein
MSARSAEETSPPLAWPLAGSLVLTTAAVWFLCTPPATALHSWTQLVSRATVYLLVAGCVHALAVWGVCRVRDESEGGGRPVVWTVIWTAWVAIVWLPLIALLTAEHSVWVAGVLPVTAVFATLLLRRRAVEAGKNLYFERAVEVAPFQLLKSTPLWRVLLAPAVAAVALQIGMVMLIVGHGWTAGCLFGAGAIYPVERWLDRTGTAGGAEARGGRWGRAATGNSVTVWLLLLLALIPFMAAYAAGRLDGLLGIQVRAAPRLALGPLAHSKSSGYTGVILVQPRKPQEIVAPLPMAVTASLKDTQVIQFDGAYWYFKEPDTRPAPNAHVMQGDPIKRHVKSTDEEPLIMEAHQPLRRELAMSCCRSLRVDVKNGDNVPGVIAVEVLLGDTKLKNARAVSLGNQVLATSAVSPMPLQRVAVDDTLTFRLPRSARGATFNEITVRIKPSRERSLAGAQVAVKDFVLQP